MYETVAYVVGGFAGFWLLNRLLYNWLFNRAVRQSYRNDMQRVLTAKEHQVKGRFE
jgi:hypothetical protein